MKIFVNAKPGAKTAGVEKIDDTHFKVAVKEPAKEGKANYAIMSALAEYFGISLAKIRLVSGMSSRQ